MCYIFGLNTNFKYEIWYKIHEWKAIISIVTNKRSIKSWLLLLQSREHYQINFADWKVCDSYTFIVIARLNNDPSSPKERQRVTRCFTKWHRQEISGPLASYVPPPITYRVMRISFTSVLHVGESTHVLAEPYIFTLAHVSSPSSPSCSRCRCRCRFEARGRRRGLAKGKK